MKTIIYTTLTLPSPIQGEGKNSASCVYFIRRVEYLVMQSSPYKGKEEGDSRIAPTTKTPRTIPPSLAFLPPPTKAQV
jgi:hypothetical protein